MKALHTAARVLAGLLILAAVCLVTLYLTARVLLAPLPGEWSIPLRLGPVQLEASVPTLIRLVTAPSLAPLLHGRTLAMHAGPTRLAWQESSRTLTLRCVPCAVRAPGLGSEPLAFGEVLLTLQRQGELLSGTLSSGKVRASWRSKLEKDGLRLQLQLPMTPIADVYALFRATIPELAQARIEGVFGLAATLSLPGSQFSMTPDIQGFQVSGLGTEALVNARSSCSKIVSRLTPDSWLTHAVVAAEDQRLDESSGQALTPPGAALKPGAALPPGQGAGPQGQAGQGSSTLSQQLAKMLVTGDAHSPVRKLRELLYAVEMERTLGKPSILQLYLTHAPWGPGVCGAEAAAKRYFGRRADLLSPSQAAWLAAMLHDPRLEVEHWASTGQINVARTQWVLQGMPTLPRKQRLRLAEEVAKVKWKAPPPKP